MRIAIYNFANISLSDLEHAGREAAFHPVFESKNKERKKSYWAARYAAAFLMRHAGIVSKISHEKSFGFPVFLNAKGEIDAVNYISLAHTGELATVAISQNPIGIDVEKIDRNAKNVIERVLSPAEKKTYAQFPEKIKVHGVLIEKSLLFWVMKEAVAKATGLGMTKGLEMFEVEKPNENFYPVTIKTDTPLTIKDPACYPFIVGNYLFSLCTEKDLLLGGIFGGGLNHSLTDRFGGFFRLLDLNGKFEKLDRLENS